MLRLRRDGHDELTAIGDLQDGADGLVTEAWTQVEIDRLDPHQSQLLEAELLEAVNDVHRVVADFATMRDRMLELATADPLLVWLANGQFVFLGAATYDFGSIGAVCRPGSTLGQLSESSPIDPEIVLDGPRVSVVRSALHATIHRNSRHDGRDRPQ